MTYYIHCIYVLHYADFTSYILTTQNALLCVLYIYLPGWITTDEDTVAETLRPCHCKLQHIALYCQGTFTTYTLYFSGMHWYAAYIW